MTQVFFSIGTNLGDKIANICFALENINASIGVIKTVSSVFETDAWGYESENTFYNIALECFSNMTPFEILNKCKEIEKNCGRSLKDKKGYADRVLDIDILFYGNKKIDNPNLQIPHPLRTERAFVLAPMNEIAKNYLDSEKNATIQELFLNCHDKMKVKRTAILLNWR